MLNYIFSHSDRHSMTQSKRIEPILILMVVVRAHWNVVLLLVHLVQCLLHSHSVDFSAWATRQQHPSLLILLEARIIIIIFIIILNLLLSAHRISIFGVNDSSPVFLIFLHVFKLLKCFDLLFTASKWLILRFLILIAIGIPIRIIIVSLSSYLFGLLFN